MVPAFSFVARCWFNNPRPPDLRTWVKGVSSADLLHEVKHAETHTLAMGLLDLVFTKHKQARNSVTTCKPQRKDIGILPTDRIHTIRCQNQRMEEEKAWEDTRNRVAEFPRTFLFPQVWYASKKNDANIQNAFPKCVCGAAPATNWKASSAHWKASSGNQRFLPKKRKASSEERWVWTHISFRNAVQLHLLYGSSGAAFASSGAAFVSSEPR